MSEAEQWLWGAYFVLMFGACAICLKKYKNLVIDHCHNTGRVRGLLCHRCNVLIGGWDDLAWRRAATEYIES